MPLASRGTTGSRPGSRAPNRVPSGPRASRPARPRAPRARGFPSSRCRIRSRRLRGDERLRRPPLGELIRQAEDHARRVARKHRRSRPARVGRAIRELRVSGCIVARQPRRSAASIAANAASTRSRTASATRHGLTCPLRAPAPPAKARERSSFTARSAATDDREHDEPGRKARRRRPHGARSIRGEAGRDDRARRADQPLEPLDVADGRVERDHPEPEPLGAVLVEHRLSAAGRRSGRRRGR